MQYFIRKSICLKVITLHLGVYTMPKRRLKTLEDVRRYLANLINRTEEGKVDPTLAGKLGYLANSLARIIEGSDIEQRIEELEKFVQNNKKPEKSITNYDSNYPNKYH